MYENVLAAFLKATERSARILDVGGKRIGYIHLWTMSNPAFKDALDRAVLNKLADTDGLILDLRDGYGGTPFGYSDVFDTPDVVWEQTGRDGAETRHTGYDRPMTVLINGGNPQRQRILHPAIQEIETGHRHRFHHNRRVSRRGRLSDHAGRLSGTAGRGTEIGRQTH